jgi:NADPH-dependent 2,4-dienoyl-CoA reductase/sulfur reductase-like enzyme
MLEGQRYADTGIGAVAAGTSAAAKARREQRGRGNHVYEKGTAISYSTCGMPYYFGGGFVKTAAALTPRDPALFQGPIQHRRSDKARGCCRFDPARRTLDV